MTKNDERHHSYRGPGLSKYNPPIVLTFVQENSDELEDLINVLPGETLENNRWSQLYEQVLGIQIKYDWAAKGNLYYQKLGVALASGNLPDIVRVNGEQLRQLSNAGMIQDLTQVYEDYAAPLTKEILGQEGTGPFEAATVDGKLMGIPETDSSIEEAEFIWIRTDWLERLGLQPPKTMQDVLVISKAFTDQDPDQNKKKDTMGLPITQNLWDPVMGLTGFMAGYEAYPNLWIQEDSGKLVYGAVQPSVKKALKVLQDMYRTGQIDKEFMYNDGVKVKEQLTNGKYGMMYGQQWGSFWVEANYSQDRSARWKAFPIVSNTEKAAKVPLRFATHQFLAVKKGYAHPEAIVKLLNLHLEKNWGATAEYETYYSTPYPVWKLSPVTPYPALKNLDAYYQIEEARRTGNSAVLKDEARAIQKYMDGFVTRNDLIGWGWEKTYGPTGAFAILDHYRKNNQLLYDSFAGASTDTMIDMEPILDTLKNDTFINIIIGRPLEDFDSFVKEWYRLGGAKMTEEVNEWYRNKKE
ncbi:ABC transporter substrate-binding protein [Paenibacillus sp. CAA11]|uniref:extracellular solute-binding protein n=1 Tax=Paenibacillus sp. CAA11 TaxID=1532905 RepID=UPI000D3696C0|nr:extracellular solute-binding protein [Paenibacillus sp. CAA11]AWB46904.1 ABC transporter substrate-binding protein [Paenibacillus sp. CAA11]